jgi:hypothetical protein
MTALASIPTAIMFDRYDPSAIPSKSGYDRQVLFDDVYVELFLPPFLVKCFLLTDCRLSDVRIAFEFNCKSNCRTAMQHVIR